MLFLDLYKAGLAYRKKSKVNWDPVDQTVLANEQVIDGRGWRSGALVESRDLTQWFFRITAYSDDLLAALDRLDRWPDKVRLMQRNWIGKSEGMRVRFAFDGAAPAGFDTVEVFTTRHDTLFGASFIALSPDHPLATALSAANAKLADFIAECHHAGTSEAAIEGAEKKGFDTGLRVIHPFRPEVTLPVYVANFVLMDYGTGAIFGCPAHDQRDLDFARKYGLKVIPVVLAARRRPADLRRRQRGLCRGRHPHQFRLPRRDERARRQGGRGQPARGHDPLRQAARRRARSTTASATGASRASATGAVRFR